MHHTFTDHHSIDTTTHPALVGKCYPYPIFAAMLASSTLQKWQYNEGTYVFPTRGPNQPHRPGMATLFRCMNLHLANAIFCNVFLSPSSTARPGVDDECFVTKASFLIPFGDLLPFRWDNSTIYLRHGEIYAFDASKRHSLPNCPASLSPCGLGNTMMKCLGRRSMFPKNVAAIHHKKCRATIFHCPCLPPP